MFHGASESPAPPSFMPTRRWPPRFGFAAAPATAVPRKPGTARTAPAAAERSRSSRRVSPSGRTSLMLVPLSVPDPGTDPTAAPKRPSSACNAAPARVAAVAPPARAGIERVPAAAVDVHDIQAVSEPRDRDLFAARRDDARAVGRPRRREVEVRPGAVAQRPRRARVAVLSRAELDRLGQLRGYEPKVRAVGSHGVDAPVPLEDDPLAAGRYGRRDVGTRAVRQATRVRPVDVHDPEMGNGDLAPREDDAPPVRKEGRVAVDDPPRPRDPGGATARGRHD